MFETSSSHRGKGRLLTSTHGWLIARVCSPIPYVPNATPPFLSCSRNLVKSLSLGCWESNPDIRRTTIPPTDRPPSRNGLCDFAFFFSLFFRLRTDVFPLLVTLSFSVPPPFFPSPLFLFSFLLYLYGCLLPFLGALDYSLAVC